MQRLPEAVESLSPRAGTPVRDGGAKPNLDLCERLLAEAAGRPLDRDQQTQLLDAILAQKRTADSVLLARTPRPPGSGGIGPDSDPAQEPGAAGEVERFPAGERADGTFALDLSNLVVPDLSILRGLPIGALKLGRGTVTDLGPLAALP